MTRSKSIRAEGGAAAASTVARSQASVQGLRSWVCLKAEVESSKGFQWGERQPVVEGEQNKRHWKQGPAGKCRSDIK